MHIGFVLPSLRGGGAERVMVTLSNAMAAAGHRVDLIVVGPGGEYRSEISDSVQLIELKKNRILRALFRLRKYIVRQRPEYLVSTMTHVNIAVLLANMLAGTRRSSVCVREAAAPLSSAKNATTITGKLLPVCIFLVYRFSYRVLAVSTDVRNELLEIDTGLTEKTELFYNPVFSADLLARSNSNPQHPWLQHKQLPVIIGMGRLVVQKNFRLLLQAVALVQKTVAVRLIVYGEGPLRDELTALVQELGLCHLVDLPGFVHNPFAELRAADLFVLSSNWEGLPNVLIQSLACGTAVVSTDSPGGSREILQDGEWGELVAMDQPEQLSQAIIRQLNSPIAANYETRARDFSVDRAVRQLESLCNES